MRMRREDLPGLAAGLIVLGFRLLWLYVRVKVRSARAARVFRRHLIRGGMDRALAGQLADDYRGNVSLRKLLAAARLPFLS